MNLFQETRHRVVATSGGDTNQGAEPNESKFSDQEHSPATSTCRRQSLRTNACTCSTPPDQEGITDRHDRVGLLSGRATHRPVGMAAAQRRYARRAIIVGVAYPVPHAGNATTKCDVVMSLATAPPQESLQILYPETEPGQEVHCGEVSEEGVATRHVGTVSVPYEGAKHEQHCSRFHRVPD